MNPMTMHGFSFNPPQSQSAAQFPQASIPQNIRANQPFNMPIYSLYGQPRFLNNQVIMPNMMLLSANPQCNMLVVQQVRSLNTGSNFDYPREFIQQSSGQISNNLRPILNSPASQPGLILLNNLNNRSILANYQQSNTPHNNKFTNSIPFNRKNVSETSTSFPSHTNSNSLPNPQLTNCPTSSDRLDQITSQEMDPQSEQHDNLNNNSMDEPLAQNLPRNEPKMDSFNSMTPLGSKNSTENQSENSQCEKQPLTALENSQSSSLKLKIKKKAQSKNKKKKRKIHLLVPSRKSHRQENEQETLNSNKPKDDRARSLRKTSVLPTASSNIISSQPHDRIVTRNQQRQLNQGFVGSSPTKKIKISKEEAITKSKEVVIKSNESVPDNKEIPTRILRKRDPNARINYNYDLYKTSSIFADLE